MKKLRNNLGRLGNFSVSQFLNFSSRGGFTLLEMIVSFGLFAVVIVIAIGALLAVNSAHIKAVNVQAVQDNLRFALEAMTKEMRTGRAFSPFGGAAPAYAGISFTRSDGAQVGYCRDGATLKKISGSGTDCTTASAVSSEEVTVSRLAFYVVGQSPGPSDGQPRITTALRACSRDKRLQSSFRLQTTVVQRERDR